MGKLLHGLLISCILAVVYAEDVLKSPRPIEHEEDAVAAEDHEHHRIIIVVPKEVPHHINHVHTYKISGKGIPLIHSGKVVHDHKHNGKVAHEHGHAGKSFHNHKHAGQHGHHHKHDGYLGHKHQGHVDHKGHAHQQQFADPHGFWQHLTGPRGQRPHGQIQQHQGQLQQQRRPVSDEVQYVPSSNPQGLGSFIPSEIVHGRHGIMQQFVARGDGRRSPQNVYHVQVADEDGPNVVKHLELDLANNVAKLQTPDQRQPVYQTVTQQYSKVIGVGRAVPSAEQEVEGHAGDVDGGSADDGDGDLSLEDGNGYRFGEGYRLALESDSSHDYSAAQEQGEEEVANEYKEPVNFGLENDGNAAFSQAYRVQF